MTKASIQKLIAQDQVPSALERMVALLNAYLLLYPKDQAVAKLHTVLITNSGKYKGLEQDQALGILQREDEQITLAQVRNSVLYVLDELPEVVWQTKTPDLPKTAENVSSDFDYDLFLSFSSKDREAARLLWETLRGLGYRVFLSDEALKAYAGMSFLEKINAALRQSQHFLLLCTPHAMESHWVKLECETFFTHFHLPTAQQRRFFIFERGGKKSLAEVYHNLQTVEELPHLVELLQNLNGQPTKAPIILTPTIVDHELTQPEKAIEARLQQEQTQLEQAASVEVRASPDSSKADLTQVKNSALLIDFYQKYGEKATATQFFQFHESIIQSFGAISELELDDLIAELVQEEHERLEQERKRKAIIEVEIPQSIQAFVTGHKGEWARRDGLFFLDELSRRFDGILAKSTLATFLDEAKEQFHKVLKDFVFIKGGTFLMGAPKDEPESSDEEKPQHQVQVSDFYFSKYPVMLAQFEAFIQATGYQTDADRNGGSNFWTGGTWELKAGVNWRCDVNGQPQNDKQHPVIHVSWNDAQAYCNWLAEQIKMPVRLPYEAEWEYACRAGTTTPFNTGTNLSTDQANYTGNYPYNNAPKGTYLKRTSPVGAYAPNTWGLHDMHGNVWEWCEDWYSDTYYQECAKQGLVLNPQGPDTGSLRVLRGGSWIGNARDCRSADRNRFEPEDRNTYVGFRPVVSL